MKYKIKSKYKKYSFIDNYICDSENIHTLKAHLTFKLNVSMFELNKIIRKGGIKICQI